MCFRNAASTSMKESRPKETSMMRNFVTRTLVTRGLLVALVLTSFMMTISTASMAQIAVGISVRIGPPALPVYEQPLCPSAGYMWTPGYWAWDDDDGYYWVPGTWVEAPVGLLWTPGWWGWNNGFYVWNAGYWGPHVGFYGGVNYGYGYGGNGFYGGEWRGGAFFYNTAVMHVDTVHITNVYVNRTVIVNNSSHVAFNGGQGGIQARPTAQQETWAHESHREALPAQVQQRTAASHNRALFASENHGRPAVAATARPGEFSGHGVIAAKAAGAAYHAPKMSPKEARAPARHEGNEAAKGNTKPVTPPHKNDITRPGSVANNKPAPHSNEARPAKEFNPPKSAARPANEAKAKPSAARPQNEERARNERAKNEPRAPKSEPRPKPETHAAPAPHESAPKAAPRESAPKAAPRESAPKAAPRREAAPKSEPHEEKHPGR